MTLQVEDLVETPDGLRVLIRRSKTDQEGQGAEVAILRGCRLRLVEAVRSWLAPAGISTGPVFRAEGWARAGGAAIGDDRESIRRARRPGGDPAQAGGYAAWLRHRSVPRTAGAAFL